jgi:hypothetical protein
MCSSIKSKKVGEREEGVKNGMGIILRICACFISFCFFSSIFNVRVYVIVCVAAAAAAAAAVVVVVAGL